MKKYVFWDVAPCSSCVNRRFGGTYRLHLQVRKIRERGTSVSHIPEHGILYTKNCLTHSILVHIVKYNSNII
jgi:hypothetical protein